MHSGRPLVQLWLTFGILLALFGSLLAPWASFGLPLGFKWIVLGSFGSIFITLREIPGMLLLGSFWASRSS